MTLLTLCSSIINLTFSFNVKIYFYLKKDMKSLSKVSEGAGMGLTFNGNHLYKNLGNRRFEDKTDHAGVRLSGWGWGAFFFDFDNDGDLDVLNGNGK